METNTSLSPNEPGARIRWTEPISGLIKIAGTLHVETADALRQLLSEILNRQSPFPPDHSEDIAQVDLSDVEVCGTAGVQLLISAQKTAASRHIPLRLVAPSPAVETAFARFGIDGIFYNNAKSGDSLQ